MDIIKICGIGLIALILIVLIKQYRPEFAIYISIITGILIITLISGKVEEVITLVNNLSQKAQINTDFIGLLIKITGIAFLSEFAVSICKDSGESAIATKIEIGGKIIILALSIPIITNLLEIILDVLP